MIIATYVKNVPGPEARLSSDGTRIHVQEASFALDGMDEYGVEAAVRLKEAGQVDEIVAIAVGPAHTDSSIRSALALGADRGLLLEYEDELDPLTQAEIVADAVLEARATLLLVGGKQADWDSAALGPAVAERLRWPMCDWTTSLTLVDDKIVARHDVDDGSESWEARLPAVLSTQQGLNEPRYPTLPNIIQAKRKPIERRAVSVSARLRTVAASLPSRARAGVRLEGEADEVARELLRRLHDEAKVL